ncbi:hypothetical protein PJL15_04518 [Paenarthrobacter nitroguajacolicus]|nr:hypothetical protein [Paenarthrobacter nitroguajacolicus]
MVQSGKAQPPSRAVMALRMWGGKIRLVRPMLRIWESVPSTMGMMSASQAILRMVLGWMGPVNVAVPVLMRGPAMVLMPCPVVPVPCPAVLVPVLVLVVGWWRMVSQRSR